MAGTCEELQRYYSYPSDFNFLNEQINSWLTVILPVRTCSTPEGEDCEPKNDIIVCDRTVCQNTIQVEVLI